MRIPKNDEYVGKIVEFLGGGKVKIEKKDGTCIICRIVGRIRAKKIQIRMNDYVLIKPWSIEPDKGDIIWRYIQADFGILQRNNLI